MTYATDWTGFQQSAWRGAGMPGSGPQYSVMGRPQDPRSSMFSSSLNLNGEFQPKDMVVIFDWKATCRRHRMTPNNRLRGVVNCWPDNGSTLADEFCKYPFGDLLWRGHVAFPSKIILIFRDLSSPWWSWVRNIGECLQVMYFHSVISLKCCGRMYESRSGEKPVSIFKIVSASCICFQIEIVKASIWIFLGQLPWRSYAAISCVIPCYSYSREYSLHSDQWQDVTENTLGNFSESIGDPLQMSRCLSDLPEGCQ